jgi:hypothetical protein
VAGSGGSRRKVVDSDGGERDDALCVVSIQDFGADLLG